MSRELRVGDVLPRAEYPVDLWPMKLFSLLMADPNPLHFDPGYVAGLGDDPRPVNQGTLTVAYPLDALIAWLGGADASARIARFTCRFSGTLRAGDVVVAGGTVTALAADGSAQVDLWLDLREGSRVLSGSAVVAAVAIRPAQAVYSDVG